MMEKLSLGELRSAAGCFEAVFLTLFHSRVTSQEAGFLEYRAQLCVEQQQCAGKAVADCACLSGDATACNGADNVKFTVGLGQSERLTNDQLERCV